MVHHSKFTKLMEISLKTHSGLLSALHMDAFAFDVSLSYTPFPTNKRKSS